MSRSVWLKRELGRADASNHGTIQFEAVRGDLAAPPSELPAGSFEDTFRRHYAAVRDLLNDHRRPGLGLVAVGWEGLEATAWLGARKDEANPVILGRHGSAEIFLPSDPRLSLRHLAVVVHRHRAPAPVRFRVLDLRTPTSFGDEEGRRLEAIGSEGPLMIRCASFAVLMFPTGRGDAQWPEAPEVAWQRVPARVYVDSRSADPGRWLDLGARGERPIELRESSQAGITLVPSFPGPVFTARAPAPFDPPRGELVVASSAGQVSLPLGARAARQGVLLGRYDRCDTAGLPVLASPSLSRVHLLLIELDGVLYAVDRLVAGVAPGTLPSRRARAAPAPRARRDRGVAALPLSRPPRRPGR